VSFFQQLVNRWYPLCVVNSSHTSRLTFSKLCTGFIDTLEEVLEHYCSWTLSFKLFSMFWIEGTIFAWSTYLALKGTLYSFYGDMEDVHITFWERSFPSAYFIHMHQLTTVSNIDNCFKQPDSFYSWVDFLTREWESTFFYVIQYMFEEKIWFG
jgi:hypothetical protein